MTKNRLFKIFLWVWVASIPLMLVTAFVASRAASQHLDSATTGLMPIGTAIPDHPLSPFVRALNVTSALLGLYMFVGWIPVVVFALLRAKPPKQG